MRKLGVFAALSLSLAISTGSAFKNEPDGFRGIMWGTSFNKVAGELELSSEWKHPIDGTIRFRRKSEVMRIGEAELSNIYYFFFKEKFYYVLIDSKENNGQALLNEMRKEFGPELKRFESSGNWIGEKIDGYYLCREKTLECGVSLRVRSVQEEIEYLRSERIRGRKNNSKQPRYSTDFGGP